MVLVSIKHLMKSTFIYQFTDTNVLEIDMDEKYNKGCITVVCVAKNDTEQN